MAAPLNTSHVQPGANNATDNLRPLETIMPLLDELLDVEVPFAKVVNQAYICLQKIGNTRRARYAVEVPVEDGYAELPPHCEQIEAVFVGDSQPTLTGVGLSQIFGTVYNPTDADFLTNQLNPADSAGRVAVAPDQVRGFRQYRVGESSVPDLAPLGERFVDYTFRDGALIVGRQASLRERASHAAGLSPNLGALPDDYPQTLRVVFRGIVADERGYPLITPEETLACAYFTAVVQMYKKYTAKMVGRQDWLDAEALAIKHIAQAHTAPLASSNGLDKMLDAKTSYHRHFPTDDFYVR